MKYFIRGSAYILPFFEEASYGSASGMPCSTTIEASSKKEAEEKGLKKLKKELSNFEVIKIIEVGRVTKDYPNTLD